MSGTSRRAVAVGAVALVALAAGCSSDSPDEAETPPHAISIGIGEPASLIPTNSTEPNGSQVLASLFYPLVRFDEQRQPHPVAAASITPDKANRVWTVKLQPQFTFSNGEPVTADNYIAAWNYGAYKPNGQLASYFFSRIEGYADLQSIDPDGGGPQPAQPPKTNKLSGLDKVDDLTFRITLSAGFAGWMSVLGYDAFYPLPKAAFRGDGVLAEGFGEAPVGNGPFRMKGTWEHDKKIVVERAGGFRGTAPKVDAITWRIYRDLGEQYADLTAGDLDVETKIPIDRLPSAIGDLGPRLQKSPSSLFSFIGFPSFEKEYQNKDVRRAISMAINRAEITEQIFRGAETPATSFVSPVVAGYRPGSCGANCEYRPAEARRLYAAAGGPATITITYNTDGGHQAWVDATCGQIRGSLGVNCTGAGLPTLADILDRVRKRQPVGLIRLSWTMDYPLMESYLTPLYTTDGASNYYGYTNPAFDSLVREGSEAPTAAAAQKKWQEAEDILATEMPVLPLRYGQNVFGRSERVAHVTMDLFQRVDIYQIERV
jgi:oligopeptide transport system substrate-binding protein